MLEAPVFTPDFRETPWWWTSTPEVPVVPVEVPDRVDAAIIGSGVTGLSAAIHLARAGRRVAVFDAGHPGYGASTRNFGVIGRSLQHSFTGLAGKYGLAQAKAVYGELHTAFQSVIDTLQREEIACRFHMAGRFNIAISPRHFQLLAREYDAQRQHLGVDAEMIDQQDQSREIAIEGEYHGGVLIRDLGLLDPGLYHAGLLQAALRHGVLIVPHTPVLDLQSETSEVTIRLAGGTLCARDVVVATNGYTGAATPWARRRLIPFSSFVVATEELPADLVQRILPGNRNFTEATRNPYFIRQTPDGRRVLFGGLTGVMPKDGVTGVAVRLVQQMRQMLPGLGAVRISHAWSGQCAGTFDRYPHLAIHDRIHYALGYCFAGLPMGTYLGQRVAGKIIGVSESAGHFDSRSFPTVPFYKGNPWFLPTVFSYYGYQDRKLRKES